jgi:hypothetical protein
MVIVIIFTCFLDKQLTSAASMTKVAKPTSIVVVENTPSKTVVIIVKDCETKGYVSENQVATFFERLLVEDPSKLDISSIRSYKCAIKNSNEKIYYDWETKMYFDWETNIESPEIPKGYEIDGKL